MPNKIAMEAATYLQTAGDKARVDLAFVAGCLYIFNRICASGYKEGASIESCKAEGEAIRAELNEICKTVRQKNEIEKQTGRN